MSKWLLANTNSKYTIAKLNIGTGKPTVCLYVHSEAKEKPNQKAFVQHKNATELAELAELADQLHFLRAKNRPCLKPSFS